MKSTAIELEKKLQAWTLFRQGNLKSAKSILRELCISNSHDPEAWYLFALVMSQLKEYKEAIKAFHKTLRLSPNLAEAAYNLALAYDLIGKSSDAINFYQKAVRLNPTIVEAHYNLGNLLYRQRKYRDAKERFTVVIELKPDYIDARINLSASLRMLGDYDAAENVLTSVLEKTKSIPALEKLVELYQIRKKYQEAIECYKRLVQVTPDSVSVWIGLAKLYEFLGKYADSMVAYKKAVCYDPNNLDILFGIATAYYHTAHFNKCRNQIDEILRIDPRHIQCHLLIASIKVLIGKPDEALEYVKKAESLNIDPNDSSPIVLKAKIFETMGKVDEAMELLKPLINSDKAGAAEGAIYGNVCYKKESFDTGIGYLEAMLKNGDHTIWGLRQIHFTLGKLYDAIGNYSEAFNNYKSGNELKYCNYASGRHCDYVDKIIKTFGDDYYEKYAHACSRAINPIFVVGMPRSGTTLVEQILSCHPNVAACGELAFVHETAKKLGDKTGSHVEYPECMSELTVEVADYYAEKFVEVTTHYRNKERYVTDKLPQNFLHLGLISLLFPSARIIHCQRNPIDTCLSNYFQDFAGMVNWAYRLEDLAHYYKAYQRIMVHWEQVLKVPLMTIKYERLIEDHENESRKIIEFCGLEWDPQCLKFNKSRRFVNTASYQQVSRPIYRSSVERWRNYEDYIGTLLELLGE